ncbi:MAG: hypothetical protein R2848_14445 [Thermomicrobiales bacterium]
MRRLLPFRDRPTVEHQVYDLPARESCDRCDALLEGAPDFTHFRICPVCERHFGISAQRRIEYLSDPGSFEERDPDLYSTDPLEFADDLAYVERLREPADANWPIGRDARGDSDDRRRAGGAGGARFHLPGRQHGHRRW